MIAVKDLDLLFLATLSYTSLLLIFVLLRRFKLRKEKTSESGFAYPNVEQCQGNLSNIKPIPYRPFRWGNYNVTMGIRSMDWNNWIELDQQFPVFYRIRETRIRDRGNKLIKTLDAQPGIVGSGNASAKELMYELAEYLSRRYPDVFTVTRHPTNKTAERGWENLGVIRTVTIVNMGKTFDLDNEDPMTVAALMVQDDLAIMLEGSDGRYYLQAGAIVIPGTWRLEDKAGMPLDEIHTSGSVPLYREKLQTSLGRFFKRLPVEKPVIRNNYVFQFISPPSSQANQSDPDELAWATSVLGDEDHQPAEHVVNPKSPPTPERIRLRTERQTLRRLPKTGAIVFTIRTYQTPVEKLVQEPGVPGRLASAIRSWPEAVAGYKHRELFEPVLLEYLDEWHKKQIEENIDKVDSSYPW